MVSVDPAVHAASLDPAELLARVLADTSLHSEGEDLDDLHAFASELPLRPSAAELTQLGRMLERDAPALRELALGCHRAAVAAAPESSAPHFELAGNLARAADYDGAIASMVTVLSMEPWAHAHWRVLSQLERARGGRKAEAAHCLLMALRAHPDSEAAWAAAVRAAVAPGMHVLDAGEGHGLHALVALSAGAYRAVRCESLLPVAAREIARRNVPRAAAGAEWGRGEADALSIFPDVCAALQPPGGPGASLLAAPAGLLIVDVLRADALASGLGAIVADARTRGLLADGATVLPSSAVLRGCLVESRAIGSLGSVRGAVCGLDVSEFNRCVLRYI
ncbi:hypothetical protein T492DRAFT_889559 [Pavlovales sp. CCMP2436]|nr:hypothetical protein T492DRAFT_889559 [Pavlovales sp. CCMP2436]